METLIIKFLLEPMMGSFLYVKGVYLMSGIIAMHDDNDCALSYKPTGAVGQVLYADGILVFTLFE